MHSTLSPSFSTSPWRRALNSHGNVALLAATLAPSLCSSQYRFYAKPATASTDDAKPLLGRPSNNLRLGVVGLPNVGKSTLFNVLTSSNVLAANYPFATIDPAEGKVAVPDTRFDALCRMYSPQSAVPAKLSITDIAGLVRGAASGAGLGNAFLSHIRAVDGIYHVVRCFKDAGIVHVEESGVDPARDLGIISDELRLKDMEFLEKEVEEMKKKSGRAGQGAAELKARQDELRIVEKVCEWVAGQNRDVRHGDWTSDEVTVINRLQLLTAKPVVYLANVDEETYVSGKSDEVKMAKEWVEAYSPGDKVIPVAGALEDALCELDEAERIEYLSSLGNGNVQSALPSIIVSGYEALSLINFFTAGPGEVRSWTIRKGSKAPQAAGVIHTDFERGFIAAEVMEFADLAALGSEAAVKAAGKYSQRGKEYTVQSGDVCFFKFNVTKGNKK
ncbi:GTP-binding protein YchF [Catenaria anguillulae PL171]|uniref:Obg-like ATPase 1 n=1 Tax=Catenaria anguillulae PL171 TaxID=765915 RepID=A0A1Y2HFE8_9FUNG|nr:GTP-binding protein YchF [Catenaria anguillulae PL171]